MFTAASTPTPQTTASTRHRICDRAGARPPASPLLSELLRISMAKTAIKYVALLIHQKLVQLVPDHRAAVESHMRRVDPRTWNSGAGFRVWSKTETPI